MAHVDPAWITVIFVVGGQLGALVLVVDNWVHKQGSEGVNVRSELEQLVKENRVIRRMIQKANARASRDGGALNIRLLNMDRELVRLKTIIDEGHFHRRHTDPSEE